LLHNNGHQINELRDYF